MMVNLPCLMESCPNFLRPTCSSTECWISFPTGSCPTERTPPSYSSCLYLISLTGLLYKVLIISGRYTLLHCVGHMVDAVFLLHRYRVSLQNPAHAQNVLGPSKGLDLSAVYRSCLCCRYFRYTWSLYVH